MLREKVKVLVSKANKYTSSLVRGYSYKHLFIPVLVAVDIVSVSGGDTVSFVMIMKGFPVMSDVFIKLYI
jgi:hypothetical protein